MSNRLTKGKALVGALNSDAAITAVTGDVTATAGNVVATVGDLKCSASTGAVVAPYGVYFDTSGKARHDIICIPIGPITGTSDTDTGVDLPSNGFVRDAWVKITTASSSTYTLDVGLLVADAGTSNGFLTAIACSSTGVKVGHATFSSTGTNAYPSITALTRGPYLCSAASGSTGQAYYCRRDYPIDTKTTALSVSYSLSTASAAIRGHIFLDVISL